MSDSAVDITSPLQPKIFVESIRESPSRPCIRIAIWSRSGSTREGLKALLRNVPGIAVIGAAEDLAAALALVSGAQADILLLDRFDESEMHFLRRIRRWMPGLRILLVAETSGRSWMAAALEQGAQGVVWKESASAGLLRQAVQSITEGDYWLGEKRIRDLHEFLAAPAIAAGHRAQGHRFGLTDRELDVLPLLMQGRTNPEIAKTLQISTQTVKHHLAHIFHKVGVSNRLELALFAIHHRLIGNGSRLA